MVQYIQSLIIAERVIAVENYSKDLIPGIHLANEFMRYLPFKIYTYTSPVLLNNMHHLHCHEYSHLCYVINGTFNIYLNDKTYVLTPGCCIFLPPFTLHNSCTVDGETDIHIVNISFHDKALTSRRYDFFSYNKRFAHFEGKQIPTFFRFTGDAYPEAEAIMRAASDEFAKHKNMSFDKIAASVADFLRLLCAGQQLSPTRKLPYVKKYSYSIIKAIDYISLHRSEKLTIDKLCEIAGMSRRLFTDQFHEVTGMTCNQFIFALRFSNAKHFLAHTALNFGHIAKDVGFVTNARLTHVFQETLGMTPSEYRESFPDGLDDDMDYWKGWSWFRKNDFEKFDIV